VAGSRRRAYHRVVWRIEPRGSSPGTTLVRDVAPAEHLAQDAPVAALSGGGLRELQQRDLGRRGAG
jgi:hypothetical protein